VYYEVGTNPYYSLTSDTFVGSLMKSLGLVNIADGDSTSADAGYPQLSAEYIASANPKLILLAGDASVASVAKRTAFNKISAVLDHHVIELNADIASAGTASGHLDESVDQGVRSVLADQKLWSKSE